MANPGEIRLDALTSLASGAKAYINPRWRPLLDGPLFGAFGWYDDEGMPTERSREISMLSAWCRDPGLAGLWSAAPVRGEVGVLLLEEAQADAYCRCQTGEHFENAFRGSWEAWSDAGFTADIVRMPQIDQYDFLYVPLAVAVSDENLARLERWVRAGGTLIAEAPFAFFNDVAHVHPCLTQRGWSRMMPAISTGAEFAPDRLSDFVIQSDDLALHAGFYRDSWRSTGAGVLGVHENGSAGIVESRPGQGRLVFIGGSLGWAYATRRDSNLCLWLGNRREEGRRGNRPFARSLTPGISVRLWQGREEFYLWIVNETSGALTACVEVHPSTTAKLEVCRGESTPPIDLKDTGVLVPGKDAVVLRLPLSPRRQGEPESSKPEFRRSRRQAREEMLTP
jgi:beta-galactosidase